MAEASANVRTSHGTPSVADVAAIWWPLGASWIFMAFELPIVSAALARFPSPEIQLAAFGGVVYPVMLLIESPVIMLLAASTALSRDWPSYRSIRHYMNTMSAGLTVLHLAVSLTPLYGLIILGLIDPPEAIAAPARIGLIVALPWTWSIAYRRFNQGFLIRHGASRAIGVGTLLRLATTSGVLLAGLAAYQRGFTSVPGVAFGTLGVIAGVVAEAAFIGWRTRPVVADFLDRTQQGEGPGLGPFLKFYVPLALTSLLALLVQPVGSAAISRMPRALESLAGWPVVIGMIFVLRSGGTAYKEVVVAILDRPGALPAVRRFTAILSLATVVLTLAVAFTPLADFWLLEASGLSPALAALARTALMLGALIPLGGVLQNYYVGYLVHAHQTRAITESMAAFLVVVGAILVAGVTHGGYPGLYVALVAFTAGNLVQLAWVWYRARGGIAARARDEASGEPA